MTGERRGARGALAPWALVLAALLLAPFAEASLPRPAAMDGAALRIASLAEPSRLAPLAASDDVERFALFAGDELAPEPAPLALASRVRENRFSLHLGVDVFGLEPLRGPPPLSEDLCQGDDECLAGTRIGGLGLLEPFAQNAEPELTLGLLPGYEVSTSGLAYGKPLDPWGLCFTCDVAAEFLPGFGGDLLNVASLGTYDRVKEQRNLGTLAGWGEGVRNAGERLVNTISLGLHDNLVEQAETEGSVGWGAVSKTAYDLTPMEEIRQVVQEGDQMSGGEKAAAISLAISKSAGLVAGAKSIGEAGAVKVYEARISKAYRHRVATLSKRGVPEMPAGKRADVVAKRWAKKEMGDYRQMFDLKRRYTQSGRRRMGADPDVLLGDYARGLEFKRSPKAARSSQQKAFEDLFPDFSIRYVYGVGGAKQATGMSVLREGLERAFSVAITESAAGEAGGN